MVSQRIEDALEVLALMRERRRLDARDSVENLRVAATKRVAGRGVNVTTVSAHLVGKNVPSKLPIREFDVLAAAWLDSGSPDLENWYLRHANPGERARVEAFFSSDAGATPRAADIADAEPPERVVTTTYRVLRDTVLARRIKAEQEYRCQLCNARLTLADGTPYAEAHHVKPLGRPHSGPDVPENILCVCPNCHVLLDYGAVSLDSGMVKTIAPEYICYHNALVSGYKSKSCNWLHVDSPGFCDFAAENACGSSVF